MSVALESVRRRRFLASPLTWRVLVGLYATVLLVILSPVLFASVTGDDIYWMLEKGQQADGSVWEAFWRPIPELFRFDDVHARTTPLAYSERQVLVVVTMYLATHLAIPPFLLWALVKVVLLALSVLVVRVFLREIAFRGHDGEPRGLDPATVALLTLAFPLVLAVGSKAQTLASLNGWNVYPTLTYGPFPILLLLAVTSLRMTRLCEGSWSRWALPTVVVMTLMAVVLNLSYEVLAVAVPLNVLLVLMRPGPREGSLRSRWRVRATVVLSLGVPYTVVFGWLRWRVSQSPCYSDGSCYNGTALDVRAGTLWNNFLGSFPGHTSDYVAAQARSRGEPFPGVSLLSLALAVLAVVVLLGLWASWRARHVPEPPVGDSRRDGRGLVVVMMTGVAIAAGISVITGINSKAVLLVDTPLVSYRSNVVVWSALCLAGLALVRLLMERSRVLGLLAQAAVVLLVLVCVAAFFPRNLACAQANRVDPGTAFGDFLHQEVALGDLSRAGDLRRCRVLQDRIDTVTRSRPANGTFRRTVKSAYTGFAFYHHGAAFCSERVGRGL